jgi:MFS family permease
MNKIIIYLIISDILILSAFGLISPIFAIYLNEGLAGGIAAAGLASTIYFLVKSLVQLPLSIWIDKKRGKLSFLLIGTLLIVAVPIMYAFSPNVKFIYLAQAIYGIGSAMAYPAWYSLFTMHLDKKHRGLEYSIWSTGVGIGTALTAYAGALFAESFGFQNLFLIVALISFIGLIVLFLLSNKFLKDIKETEEIFLNKAGHFLNHRK